MLKIGEFSRLSQVPVKTLRYYDEIGLLRPAGVDDFSGYRFYALEQLPRLNRILALKDLGFSLEQIAQALNDRLSADEIRGMLRLKRAEVQQRLEAEQGLLTRVEARLRLIEQEGQPMPANEVVIKSVPALKVASIRGTVPTYDHTGQLFGELMGHLGRCGVRPETATPCLAIYYDTEYKEKEPDVEACLGIGGDFPETDRIRIRELPATTVASLIHRGPFNTVGQSYSVLIPWIQANGYCVAGPNREIYLRGPEAGVPPEDYLTEVQFPVTRA